MAALEEDSQALETELGGTDLSPLTKDEVKECLEAEKEAIGMLMEAEREITKAGGREGDRPDTCAALQNGGCGKEGWEGSAEARQRG